MCYGCYDYSISRIWAMGSVIAWAAQFAKYTSLRKLFVLHWELYTYSHLFVCVRWLFDLLHMCDGPCDRMDCQFGKIHIVAKIVCVTLGVVALFALVCMGPMVIRFIAYVRWVV